MVVSDVEANTPAAAAGVKRGMLISQVDGRPVRTPREFRAAIAEKPGPVQLKFAGGDPSNSDARCAVGQLAMLGSAVSVNFF